MSTATQLAEQNVSVVVRDALRLENQQIRPIREAKDSSHYDRMRQKIDGKQSVHELLTALSAG